MKKVFILIFLSMVIPEASIADIIHFKDGRTLNVLSAWMERGEAKCKISGIIIGFPKIDVERIEKIPIGRISTTSVEEIAKTPVNRNKIIMYPETENRTCYDLGRSFGYCATLSLYGNTCNPRDNVTMPSRCKDSIDADRGHKDGVALAYKSLGLSTKKSSKGIGVNYDQIMNYLSAFISMEEIKAYKGERHFLGRTKDKMAMLEIIGKKSNVSQTSLMIINPKGAPQIVQKNAAMLLRFVKNTFPEWNNSSGWTTKGLHQLVKHPDNPVESIIGNKKIEMKLLKKMGAVTATVKHK